MPGFVLSGGGLALVGDICRRDAQLAHPSSSLGYLRPQHRRGSVGLGAQFLPQRLQPRGFLFLIRRNVRNLHSIDSRNPTIHLHPPPRQARPLTQRATRPSGSTNIEIPVLATRTNDDRFSMARRRTVFA